MVRKFKCNVHLVVHIEIEADDVKEAVQEAFYSVAYNEEGIPEYKEIKCDEV